MYLATAALARRIRAATGMPVVYLDVGSAGAPDPRWQRMIEEGTVRTIMVDMVEDWSRRSLKAKVSAIKVKAALGEANRDATVFVTRHPAWCSCLRPNRELLASYPVRDWFEIVREERVVLARYDDIARAQDLPQPHIAKLDVQGFEGHVLRGMGSVLDGMLCLECECHLREVYLGQDTFRALYEFMYSKGFILRDLKPQGLFEGEALEFNAFWSRKPTDEREMKILQLWEMANEVWTAGDFTAIDAHQRADHRFN